MTEARPLVVAPTEPVVPAAPAAPMRIREHSFALFRFGMVLYALRLVTSIIIARTAGPTMLGIWLLLTMLPTYAEGFARFKFDIAAVYYLGQKKYRMDETIFALNALALAVTIPLVVLCFVFQPQLSDLLFNDHVVAAWLFAGVVASIPLQFLSLNYAYLLIHLENTKAYNVQTFLRTSFPGFVTVVLLFTTRNVLASLVIGLLAGSAAALVYSAAVVHQRERIRVTFHRALYGDLARFGGRLYVSGVVEHLNTYLMGLFVGLYLPAAHLAYFRVGQDRLTLLDQIPQALNVILYPRVSKSATAAESEEVISRAVRILVLLLGAAGIAGAALAWPAVYVLYGREFLPTVFTIWILLPGVVAAGATTPVIQYLMGTGKPGYIWRTSLASLALQVALAYPLTRSFGFPGAAVALSLALVGQSAVRLVVFRRVAPAAGSVRPRREDVNVLTSFVSERLRLA